MGKLYTQSCKGRRQLNKGDEITPEEMDTIHYYQDAGAKTCEEGAKCKDTFTYKAVANW